MYLIRNTLDVVEMMQDKISTVDTHLSLRLYKAVVAILFSHHFIFVILKQAPVRNSLPSPSIQSTSSIQLVDIIKNMFGFDDI